MEFHRVTEFFHHLLATATADPTTINGVVSYGGLGMLAAGSIAAVKILFARETAALDRERARADRLEEEVRLLNRSIHEQYLPTLTRATEVMSQVLARTQRGRRDD